MLQVTMATGEVYGVEKLKDLIGRYSGDDFIDGFINSTYTHPLTGFMRYCRGPMHHCVSYILRHATQNAEGMSEQELVWLKKLRVFYKKLDYFGSARFVEALQKYPFVMADTFANTLMLRMAKEVDLLSETTTALDYLKQWSEYYGARVMIEGCSVPVALLKEGELEKIMKRKEDGEHH